MSYTARLSKSFIKSVKVFPKDVKERIAESVKEILSNPYSGVQLVGGLKGFWKKRIGKYRIVYEIDEDNKLVLFLDVGLRSKIYSRMKR